MSASIAAVIVAAGSGSRLGADLPKGFVLLGGKPLFAHSLKVFDAHPGISGLALVVPPGMEAQARAAASKLLLVNDLTVIAGGEHRWQSARAGVDACGSAEWVLIHDAARPFVTPEVIDTLLVKMASCRCAITATPVVDTIRRVEAQVSRETVDRSALVRVGTPQLFHRQSLVDAFRRVTDMTSITDEAMLMERRGIAVGIADGDPMNFKITTPQDLELAEALVARRQALLMGR